MIPAGLKPWVAFGSGVGIQIDGRRGAEFLHIAAVRVRPGGARLLASYVVDDFVHQPAGDWGTEYASFLKKHGMPHVVATVVLPRHEVIIRTVQLPGVSDKDLAGAIQFQLEGLHPYSEEDVLVSWTRLPDTPSVLVAITRRQLVERYTNLFAEAGIKIGGFSASAPLLYSALRLFGKSLPPEILSFESTAAGAVELYGESPARPLFSATFSTDAERATALAAAELRFEQAPPLVSFADIMGTAPALPFAAAMTAACPRLSLPVNLLPEEQRQSSSPMAWVPSAILGTAVVLLAAGLSLFPLFEDRRYRAVLDQELAKVQPGVTRAAALDRQISDAQIRTALLDDFRKRAKSDMDVLAELTRLLPPPGWLNSLEVTARQVNVAGETDQAAPLLRILDASPLLSGSEFTMPPIRIQASDGKRGGEGFRIRATREKPPELEARK